jgi:hypothetical protein
MILDMTSSDGREICKGSPALLRLKRRIADTQWAKPALENDAPKADFIAIETFQAR